MCTLCICHYCRNQFLAGLHRLCPQAGYIRSAGVVLSLHPLPLTFILLLLLLTASCRGRCGGEYYRGYRCQCDYNCLSYGECCNDFESQCTTSEAFSFFGSIASSSIQIFWLLIANESPLLNALHVITSNHQLWSLTLFVCLLCCICAQQKTRVRGAVEKASNEAGCVAVTLTA